MSPPHQSRRSQRHEQAGPAEAARRRSASRVVAAPVPGRCAAAGLPGVGAACRAGPAMTALRAIWRVIGPGAWLWELSLVAWALLASYFVIGREGHLDWTHHALGRDFINSWAAGHMIWT